MYALISSDVVDHVVVVLTKHCWGYTFVSLTMRSITSSSKNRENSSLGSLEIGIAGPVSPEKGATVTEEKSLLHPK